MTTLIIQDLPLTQELDHEVMADVRGGVSYYVDGAYWGEGGAPDLRPWPGGVPTVKVWGDGTRTPYF